MDSLSFSQHGNFYVNNVTKTFLCFFTDLRPIEVFIFFLSRRSSAIYRRVTCRLLGLRWRKAVESRDDRKWFSPSMNVTFTKVWKSQEKKKDTLISPVALPGPWQSNRSIVFSPVSTPSTNHLIWIQIIGFIGSIMYCLHFVPYVHVGNGHHAC